MAEQDSSGRWTMTKAEYGAARRHEYAGRNPDGTYWALVWTEHGTTLVTVEVRS